MYSNIQRNSLSRCLASVTDRRDTMVIVTRYTSVTDVAMFTPGRFDEFARSTDGVGHEYNIIIGKHL